MRGAAWRCVGQSPVGSTPGRTASVRAAHPVSTAFCVSLLFVTGTVCVVIAQSCVDIWPSV